MHAASARPLDQPHPRRRRLNLSSRTRMIARPSSAACRHQPRVIIDSAQTDCFSTASFPEKSGPFVADSSSIAVGSGKPGIRRSLSASRFAQLFDVGALGAMRDRGLLDQFAGRRRDFRGLIRDPDRASENRGVASLPPVTVAQIFQWLTEHFQIRRRRPARGNLLPERLIFLLETRPGFRRQAPRSSRPSASERM